MGLRTVSATLRYSPPNWSPREREAWNRGLSTCRIRPLLVATVLVTMEALPALTSCLNCSDSVPSPKTDTASSLVVTGIPTTYRANPVLEHRLV